MSCPRCATNESKIWRKIPEEGSKICNSCYRRRERERHKDSIAASKARHYQQNRNPELEKLKRRTPDYRWSYLKSNSARRGLEVVLSRSEFDSIISSPCYYCGSSIDVGIDRLNSDENYSGPNCVPCCSSCNYLKGDLLSPAETLAAIRALKEFRSGGLIQQYECPLYKPQALRDRSNSRFTKLELASRSRNIPLLMTKEEYQAIINNANCHYCQAELPTNGYALDRIDNNKGYEVSNVLPCCPVCNKIRSNQFSVEETRALVSGVQAVRLGLS